MDQRTREMHEMYADGATLEEVGACFGITRERVRQRFRDAGLPTRSVSQTSAIQREELAREMHEEILAAYQECKDIAAVKRRLGLSYSVVAAVVGAAISPAERRLGRKPPPKHYSDAEVISCIKRAARAADGVLVHTVYDQFARGQRFSDGRPWPTHQTAAKRFGSWRKALGSAGLKAPPPSPRGRRRRFDDAGCIMAVRLAIRELGNVPTIAEYEDFARRHPHELPSAATVRGCCGSWTAALRAAGV